MTPDEARKLLGVADNCTAQVKSVGNDSYRVNVLERVQREGSVVTVNKIVKSYFVRLINNEYIDCTKNN